MEFPSFGSQVALVERLHLFIVLLHVWVTPDGVLDWVLDLLTTFNTQLVIQPNYSAISDFHTLYKSLAKILVFSNPAVSSLVVA
jgi:hypothetical protein